MDSLSILDASERAPLHDQVIDDHVLRLARQMWRDQPGVWRDNAPRRRELRVVEQRALELHRPEDSREHIHWARRSLFRNLRHVDLPDKYYRDADKRTRRADKYAPTSPFIVVRIGVFTTVDKK